MENNLTYREKLALIRSGQMEKTTKAKPKKPIAKVSKKRLAEDKAAKEGGTDNEMDKFFSSQRRKMTGRCLFCNGRTNRDNEDTFHFCIAHLLPKRPIDKGGFPSVGTNEDNWIELCFYGNSCHTNFDNGKITWEFLRDSKEWDIIKEKLLNVLPLVAIEERKHKLYSHLEKLVYENNN